MSLKIIWYSWDSVHSEQRVKHSGASVSQNLKTCIDANWCRQSHKTKNKQCSADAMKYWWTTTKMQNECAWCQQQRAGFTSSAAFLFFSSSFFLSASSFFLRSYHKGGKVDDQRSQRQVHFLQFVNTCSSNLKTWCTCNIWKGKEGF